MLAFAGGLQSTIYANQGFKWKCAVWTLAATLGFEPLRCIIYTAS